MPPGPSRVPPGPGRARAGMASASGRGSGGVDSDPSAHPWTASEATRPKKASLHLCPASSPACPSPLRHGQAIDSIEQEIECDRQQSGRRLSRSEEHTSELQSLMRISYAVFCLKKKKQNTET